MDEQLLLWINQGWGHPWLDVFFAWTSARVSFALPLLLMILIVLRRRFARDGFKLWLLLIVLLVAGDELCNALKALIAEPRPCAEIHTLLRHPGGGESHVCRGGETKGMPSGHALNYFLFASFTAVILHSWRWGLALGLIAFVVSLSRVYLGLHYPSQVLAGGLIGALLGIVAGYATVAYCAFARRIKTAARTRTEP